MGVKQIQDVTTAKLAQQLIVTVLQIILNKRKLHRRRLGKTQELILLRKKQSHVSFLK